MAPDDRDLPGLRPASGYRHAWLRVGLLSAAILVVLGPFAVAPARFQEPAPDLPPALKRAETTPPAPVEAELRNVRYHAAPGVVLRVRFLRGTLVRTAQDEPPWFEDPNSFVIAMDTAQVAITPQSLAALLNGYTFDYEGSPLRSLEVEIEDGELLQRGTLNKLIDLPFTIRATLSPTRDGRLRIHPTSVKVVGIPVQRLMDFFGVELDDMMKVRRGRGIEVAGNDFILTPAGLLPPPHIDGRLIAVGIYRDEIRQIFGSSERPAPLPAMHPPDTAARNYMFFQGSVLRFGKLSMMDTELQIVDGDPDDAFDVYLADLNRQLTAGYSRNQPDFGVVTTMPDYADLSTPERPAPARSPS